MNTALQLPPAPVDPVARFPVLSPRPTAVPHARVVLLYETFATAVRGKAFCDQLLHELGVLCDFDEALWRTDLLAVSAVREEVVRATLKADFVILSLRGDAELPGGIRQWCAQWMPQAADRDITLIVLFDQATAQRLPMENVRWHLRAAALAAGVHFFAHAVAVASPGPDGADGEHLEMEDLPGIASRLARCGQPRPAVARPRPTTVLIVDDYPVLCDVVARQLADAGYRTLKAHDGVEAQRLIEAQASDIDLVLTDIEMPRMRGDELAVWLQREHPATPVLFMSSIRPRSPGAESLPVLEKPFRMEALVTAVQEIVGHAAAA